MMYTTSMVRERTPSPPVSPPETTSTYGAVPPPAVDSLRAGDEVQPPYTSPPARTSLQNATAERQRSGG